MIHTNMNALFTKTRDFIFAKQTSMLSSTLILSGMMIVSRIAGFIRFRILAGYFTKEELDIFYAAFRIPVSVFEILINGALSTAFIPFFVQYQKRPDEQNKVISSVINMVTLVLSGFIVILVISMPLLMPVLARIFSRASTYFSSVFSDTPFRTTPVLGTWKFSLRDKSGKKVIPHSCACSRGIQHRNHHLYLPFCRSVSPHGPHYRSGPWGIFLFRSATSRAPLFAISL